VNVKFCKWSQFIDKRISMIKPPDISLIHIEKRRIDTPLIHIEKRRILGYLTEEKKNFNDKKNVKIN